MDASWIPREAIELTMEKQEWSPKRGLGTGHWDVKLKRKMVELSVSDNYDEAKLEWRATGDVYWGSESGMPAFAAKHPGECLCGHHIVYHFEIENTENGIRECVGSDHINSYMIMRAIASEKNLTENEITDEMIEQWVNVRVESMKKESWWNRKGDSFVEMFDAVKELDLRVNVRDTGKRYWDTDLLMKMPVTKIRKRGSGIYGSPNYQMASIVWRWNHPDNPRNQQTTRGYPNDMLQNDLILFYAMRDKAIAEIEAEDSLIDARRNDLRVRANRKALAVSMTESRDETIFEDACVNYGIKPFTVDMGINSWERNFLSDIRKRVIDNTTLSQNQLTTVLRIINSEQNKEPATEKQRNFLKALGYGDDTSSLSKREASKLIEQMRNSD